MEIMDKERIKELAKESLEDKWYPIQRGKMFALSSDCAFCSDAKRRDHNGTCCSVCYIPKMTIDICNIMDSHNVDEVIELLEQLAENGEIS